MELFEVAKLKAHPQNSYFFDDISGDNWQDFLESVRTSGVIEALVITQEGVIVSGHQRARACKELGIERVLADIRMYETVVDDTFKSNELNELTGSVRGAENYQKWLDHYSVALNPDGSYAEGWGRDRSDMKVKYTTPDGKKLTLDEYKVWIIGKGRKL